MTFKAMGHYTEDSSQHLLNDVCGCLYFKMCSVETIGERGGGGVMGGLKCIGYKDKTCLIIWASNGLI